MLYLHIASVVALFSAGGAIAATVNETDFAGGFSLASPYFNPTYANIGYGIHSINGTASSGIFDLIRFTDREAGAQTLTSNFALVIPASQSNVYANAGGQLYYSEAYESGPYNRANAGTFGMERDAFNLPGTPARRSASIWIGLLPRVICS